MTKKTEENNRSRMWYTTQIKSFTLKLFWRQESHDKTTHDTEGWRWLGQQISALLGSTSLHLRQLYCILSNLSPSVLRGVRLSPTQAEQTPTRLCLAKRASPPPPRECCPPPRSLFPPIFYFYLLYFILVCFSPCSLLPRDLPPPSPLSRTKRLPSLNPTYSQYYYPPLPFSFSLVPLSPSRDSGSFRPSSQRMPSPASPRARTAATPCPRPIIVGPRVRACAAA